MGVYADKMKRNIAEAEHYHSEIVSMERQVEAQLRAARTGSDHHPIYKVARDLANNFWYERAATKRNNAINRAMMYGLAALVELVEAAEV